MSEHEPQLITVEIYHMHRKSLKHWFDYLTVDQRTGEYHGNLDTPVSRYGRTAAECAWWAIGAELAYVDACGDSDDAEMALDFYMGLAVNDHEDIANIVTDYLHVIPDCLREKLDLERIQGGEHLELEHEP